MLKASHFLLDIFLVRLFTAKFIIFNLSIFTSQFSLQLKIGPSRHDKNGPNTLDRSPNPSEKFAFWNSIFRQVNIKYKDFFAET